MNIPQWYCISRLNWRKILLKMLLCIYVASQKWQNQVARWHLYSKIAMIKRKTRASEITNTLPWQFFNTNKSKRNIASYIAYYCTLILFRTVSKWGWLYHSYTKTVKHFTDQIQNGGHLLRYWKKPALGMVLQKFILVNLRFLYKDNLKKDCAHNALMHIWTKKQKSTLPVRCRLLTKFSFAS